MNGFDILLVDDDPDILKLVSMRLEGAGYRVQAVESAEKALALFALARPKLIITDLKMSGMDGLALFETLQREAPTLPVIILTAHGTIPDAVTATRRGVFSFIPKPFEGKLLLEQVKEALRIAQSHQPQNGESWREGILTQNPKMEEVLRQAKLVAQSDAGVLILGASGSGKEILARAIHRASRRAERPFVAVNCAAIPENLLESELFGHRKGAFTGATYDHKGLFQAAEGGTLLLDEIGDMPLSLQAKLLRVLEERKVRPVGAAQSADIDVRVVSATHRDLEIQMKESRFREDLFYRLNVVTLALPPLSERREDVPLLASHFLKLVSARDGKNVGAFAPEAIDLLVASPWPGNVRQLLNVVEQSVALATTQMVTSNLVQNALRDEPPRFAPLDDAKRAFERDYLVRILRITGGNVTQASRLARRNRTEFYKLLDRHGLEPRLFKLEKS